MANKTDVRYIQFYTDGSAARQITHTPSPKKKRQAKPVRQPVKKLTLNIDPLAICGIVVAAVMLVLMLVGLADMRSAQREAEQMARYVAELEAENNYLTETYAAGYDPAEIERQARQLGMIPAGEAERIPIPVAAVPEEVPEETLWQRIRAFFTELFA